MNNATDPFDYDFSEKCDYYLSEEAEAAPGNVNVCENCGHTCDTLHHVPEWDFQACERCYDECMEQIAAEEAAAAIPAKIEPGTIAADVEVA